MTPNGQLIAPIAILALVALCLLAGCGTTGHVAMMHDVRNDNHTLGQNPVCTFEVRKLINERFTAKYQHLSWCFTSWPFNENPESTIDAFGVEAQIW